MKKIILAVVLLAALVRVSYPQVIRKLQGHTDYINTVCYSQGGRYIASGGFDGTIRIWDAEKGFLIKVIDTKYKIYKLLFSGNSEQLITGTVSLNGISSAIDSFIVSFDTRSGKKTDKFNVSSRSPNFYINENSLITLAPDLLLDSCDYSYDYSLKRYSMKNCYKVILNNYELSDNTSRKNIRLDKIHMWTFNSPWALSSDGKSLAVCPENTESQKHAAYNNNIDAKFNQDEAGNIIYFYDLDKKTLINKVRIVNSYLREKNVIISNDCKYFYYTAIEYTDDVIKVLDISKDEEVKTLKGHEREILCTALHPGGRFLASGSRDNNVIIWDLHTGKSLKVLEGHKDNVNYVSFSPNGRYLASASDDKNIIIWDLAKISNEIEVFAINYDKISGKEKYLEEEKLFQAK